MPVLGQVAGSNLPPGRTLMVEPWRWRQPTATAGGPPSTEPRKLWRQTSAKSAAAEHVDQKRRLNPPKAGTLRN